MIIFGTRGRQISGKEIQGPNCPHCGSNSYRALGVLRYFHLFWIPVFPIKKLAGVMCLHCRQTRYGKELPAPTLDRIKNAIFTRKNILPMYTGLVLIAALVVGGLVAEEVDNKKELSYLAAPQVNDYYLVDFTKIFNETDPKFKYGIMRVKSVSNSGIELQVSNYAYNKQTGPSQALRSQEVNRPDYYAGQTIYFDLTQIKNLKTSGAIYSVERG